MLYFAGLPFAIGAITDAGPADPMTSSQPPSPPPSWSEDQLIRLECERRRLQRALAYHPNIRIVAMRDDPPAEYQIEYRVRTLSVGDNGQLQYADSVPVRIALPASFPHAAPAVRPLVGVFHPNISWEGLHLGSPWQPTDTLIDLVSKIGELLAWRIYDPDTVVNPVAMDWLDANAAMLPLDASADFSPAAGGEPLDRIGRHGPSTLEQIRSQLERMRDSLLDANAPPTAADVRESARQARVALYLFSEPDVPEPLREQATRLDEWAGDLPGSLPVWDHLRRQRPAIQALRAASVELSGKRETLDQQIRKLAAISPAAEPDSAPAALAAVPDSGTLEQVRPRLPALMRETADLLKNVQDRLGALETGTPHVPVRPETELGRQLRVELEAQASSIREAQKLAEQAMASVRPLLDKAQAEAPAFEQICGLREYLDQFQTARELEQKLAMWGSAGVHACYVENPSGRFGPYQLHQAIELGRARVAVRSAGRNGIEVIAVPTAGVLAHADTGSVTVKLPVRRDTDVAFTFRITERCDELAAQFDFLIRRTEEDLQQLTASFPQSGSWCGRLLHVLSRPESLHILREDHCKASDRWKQIRHDLQQLGLLKARIETWNLLQRVAEAVPRIAQNLAKERGRLEKCTSELAGLMARCGHDMESDALIVPPHLADPYARQTQLREWTGREIAHLERVLSDLSGQVTRRMASRAGFGLPTVGPLRALPPLPPALAEAVAAITDDVLDAQLARAEALLNLPLRLPAWQSARQRSGPSSGTGLPAATPHPAPARAGRAATAARSAESAAEMPDQPFLADEQRPPAR